MNALLLHALLRAACGLHPPAAGLRTHGPVSRASSHTARGPPAPLLLQQGDLSLRQTLETCKLACDSISELVEQIYERVGGADGQGAASPGVTLKPDQSFFTLADGLVQGLLLRLLRRRVAHIVGEEDATAVQLEAPPYAAGGTVAPRELEGLVARVRAEVDRLAAGLPEGALPLTAFVDPIDGTREFCTGGGEACTICIGFADERGAAIGGLVYRPLEKPRTWAMGSAREQYARSSLRAAGGAGRGEGEGFLTSGRAVSPFLTKLREVLGMRRLAVGGAGNKALMLLEGTGACYIQDRGLSRWDTCAAEAVLAAHGGLVVKLTRFANGGELESYRYLRSEVNLDFEPGVCRLTRYNAAKGALPQLAKAAGAPLLVESAAQLNPYSNTCGVVALASSEPAVLLRYREAIQRAASTSPPEYD
ncbi:hypothetical protein AB1Y20_006088 [Prymnesium parvum]|uniref:3'(2'),5'-bisphosphate nucleotidase 1 n=1 Tax=Prymnesium parvum TaxID=97485 RepID=A0AB34J3Y0_PRYPA